VQVRPAIPSEFASVGELTVSAFRALGPQGPAGSSYELELRDVAGRAGVGEVLVATHGQRIVGSVTLVAGGTAFAEIAGEGEMSFRMLAVDPHSQGQGIGAVLVGACLDRARAAGASRVVISTAAAMHAAHRLYERSGFTRDPARDWAPHPGLLLLAYRHDLG
jgi:GNAT superfamily N-acetyltransferase